MRIVSLAWSRYLSSRYQCYDKHARFGIDYGQFRSNFTYTNGTRVQAEAGLSGILYDVTAGQLAPTMRVRPSILCGYPTNGP